MVPPLAAVILAGGRATRMGGGDKCLLILRGRPVLAHLLERLTPQAAPIALNANGDPARFAAFGLPVLADSLPGQPGPLAGVLAGMDWAAGLGFARVLTVAGDTPFPPGDLAERLAAAAPFALAASPDETGAPACIPPSASGPSPCATGCAQRCRRANAASAAGRWKPAPPRSISPKDRTRS